MIIDPQLIEPFDLSTEAKSREYALRETVDLRGLEWLKTFDVPKLKEYRRGDLTQTNEIHRRLTNFLQYASSKAIPTEEGVAPRSQTNRKYWPCQFEYGRMTTTGAQSLWGPFKAVLFDGVGTDLDQCKSALTILVWLLKKYPIKNYTCHGLHAVMEEPDCFIEAVGREKGMYKKEVKTYLNAILFNFMNTKMYFGKSETMQTLKKLREIAPGRIDIVGCSSSVASRFSKDPSGTQEAAPFLGIEKTQQV